MMFAFPCSARKGGRGLQSQAEAGIPVDIQLQHGQAADVTMMRQDDATNDLAQEKGVQGFTWKGVRIWTVNTRKRWMELSRCKARLAERSTALATVSAVAPIMLWAYFDRTSRTACLWASVNPTSSCTHPQNISVPTM